MRDIVVSNNKHLSIISLGELRKHQADGFVVMRTLFLEYKRLEEKVGDCCRVKDIVAGSS